MNSDLIFEETKIATNESEIASLEKRLNTTLPSQYREHILKYNGGFPNKECFNTQGGGRSKIHYFYSIYDGKYSNFEKSFKTFKVIEKRMLSHIFPIAYDDGGNQICISTDDKDYGAIYFWNHEEETDEPSYDNMYLIAKSFNDFLNCLFECPPLPDNL
ncbi:SMI1/KNR4 family protein [Emticicia fontis]